MVEVTGTNAGWTMGSVVGGSGASGNGRGRGYRVFGRWVLRNSISGQKSLKVGDASSDLFLRQGGRMFGGFGETFGEG